MVQEGEAKARQGRLREAEADIRRALLSRLKTVGKFHPDTAQATISLSNLVTEQSSFAEAEDLARTSVEIYQALGYPEEVTAHAFALNQLASTLFAQRKWEEAAQIYDRTRCGHGALGAIARGAAAARILAHLHPVCDQTRRRRHRSREAAH